MQNMQHEKTGLLFELLNSISDIVPQGSHFLFIRHGDRDKIPDGEFGNEIELNDKGKQRSVDFGNSLRCLNIQKIYCSPIIRCVQTAEHIVTGLKRNVPIEISTLLGDPGAFVSDGELAGKEFLQKGFEYCYERLLNHIPVPGNFDIAEGARQLNWFFESTAAEDGLNIYVSHDMIIALYAFETFGKKYCLGQNWVKYLDGLIFKK